MSQAATVIIGVRDGVEGLLRSLRSLQAQTFAGWDCIVVDDGSSADIAAAVESLGDRRIMVFRQEASGLTAALERGLREASGEFVFRLDADDEASTVRLERQLAFLRAHREIVALGSGVELVSPEGLPIKRYSYPSAHESLVAQLGHLLTPLPHSTLALRREALARVGGYRSVFRKAQDYDLLLRLAEIGRLASIPDACVRLVAASRSVTSDAAGGEQLECCVLAYVSARLRARFGADPLDGDASRFLTAFKSWYQGSRYPSRFRSRLGRRRARIAGAEGRAVAAISELARSTMEDPGWPLRPMGVGRIAADADAWADAWARRER